MQLVYDRNFHIVVVEFKTLPKEKKLILIFFISKINRRTVQNMFKTPLNGLRMGSNNEFAESKK